MAPLISPCLHVPDDSSHTLACCFPEHDDMGDWLGYQQQTRPAPRGIVLRGAGVPLPFAARQDGPSGGCGLTSRSRGPVPFEERRAQALTSALVATGTIRATLWRVSSAASTCASADSAATRFFFVFVSFASRAHRPASACLLSLRAVGC